MTVAFCKIADELANPLFEIFDGGDFVLTSYRDVEDEETTLQIFFPDPADAPRAVEVLQKAGEIVGATLCVETRTFPDEDWRLSYRKHFKIDVVSPRLAIVPVWESFSPLAGQKVLKLDPGLAFGTGQHGTTRACIDFIDREATRNPRRTFLDVGCGSGILSIAAALSGFEQVRGFDIDPEAVDSARENAKMNGLSLDISEGDLARPGKSADVVAANVLGPVLIRFAKEIASAVRPGPESRLILSGILEGLYPEVKAEYEKLGFIEMESRQIGEWKSGLFASWNRGIVSQSETQTT